MGLWIWSAVVVVFFHACDGQNVFNPPPMLITVGVVVNGSTKIAETNQISFALHWIGGLLKSATMEDAVGLSLPFSIWLVFVAFFHCFLCCIVNLMATLSTPET